MIENLKGIHETVNYKADTNLRLYNNDEAENYPEHWHTPIEIIMPIENDYQVTLGNQVISINPYDVILICPGVVHSLQAPPTGKRIIFQAEINILHQIKEIESVLSIIYPAITITAKNAPKIHEKVKKILLQIDEEYIGNSALSEASIYSSLISLFVLLGRNYTESSGRFAVGNQKQKEYTEKFISICDYINDHCTEDLTLDEIADIAGFSKYHFTRLFKQFTNITFYKYLNQKRIAHAEYLLSNPDITVTEVALHSGFSSLSAFIRMFKLIKQCTPSEFRDMYISGSDDLKHL